MACRGQSVFHRLSVRLLGSTCLAGSLSLIVATAIHAPARAQQAAAQEVELRALTIVTARRVDEDILDVPASVSSVELDDLTDNAPDAAANVARSIPNYSAIDIESPASNFASIRGVGNLIFPQNPFDTTVGYNVNGQPVSLSAGFQQLLDVDRVEVVRGPQNVLYGRGSQGGSVNYVTRQPDGRRDFRIRGEIGTDGTYLTDLIMGGTLKEGVAGRLALRTAGQDGFVRNDLINQEMGENDIAAARGSLRIDLSDNTTLTASGFFEQDYRNAARGILRNGPGFPASGLDQEPWNDREIVMGSLELKHDFEAFDFAATATLQDIKTASGIDTQDSLVYAALTGLPRAFFNAPGTNFNNYVQDERAYSGEIRFTSKPEADIRWIAGASIYSSDFFQINTDSSTLLPFINGTTQTKLELTTMSAFGEIGIPLADALILTPSLRVGTDDFKYISDFTFRDVPPPGFVASFSDSADRKEDWWAGGLTLDHKITADHLVYASVKRGHSAGGFPFFNFGQYFGQRQVAYPESTSVAYEAGFKGQFLDGRLYLAGSVFFNDVKDGHLFVFDPITNQSSIAPQDYQTTGFEIEARFSVTDSFTVFGGLGYTDTELLVAGENPQNALDGGRVPGTPDVSLNVGVEKTWDLAHAGLPGAVLTSADLQYVGDRAVDISNSFDLNSYVILNAQVGWSNDSVSVFAFGRNLTDEVPELSGLVLGTVQSVYVGRGQVLGFGAEVRF